MSSAAVLRRLVIGRLASSASCHVITPHRYASEGPELSDESESFSKFAQNWWDENGEMRALHSLNRLRVPFIRDCLLYQGHGTRTRCSKPLRDVSILDVGCGVGVLSEPLSRLGASVVGIDTSEDVLQVANKHKEGDSELQDLQYIETYIEDLVELDALKFDCVVASEVIEHVPDPQVFLKNCVSLLNPGGSLIVSTINRNRVSYFLAILLAENVFGAAPKGTHQWDKFIMPEELETWCRNENCFVNKIHGMSYLPVIDRWGWIESTDVNYILHATKQHEQEASKDKEQQ